MEEIEVKILKNADREEIFQLYIEGNWWKADERDQIYIIDRIISGSYCFAGAFQNEKLVGMGRAVSDGVSDAYIQDVIVTKRLRGKGIGEKIVIAIRNHLLENNITWIGLIANPGTSGFYKKLGFKVMEKFSPMLYGAEQ